MSKLTLSPFAVNLIGASSILLIILLVCIFIVRQKYKEEREIHKVRKSYINTHIIRPYYYSVQISTYIRGSHAR